MKQPKKKKHLFQSALIMVFSLLIGAACGLMIVHYMESTYTLGAPLSEQLLPLVGLFVGLYAAIYLQLVIHEAGHLVFGLLTGYRFSSFRIGSFMWIKTEGKLRFRRYSLAGTGGQCLMAPPDMVDGKLPVVLYNLGGSLMNLLVSLVLLGLYVLLGRNSFLGVLFLIGAVIGILYALINGIPLRTDTVNNDGHNALSLGRDPDALRAFWIQMKGNEAVSKGVRVKDMPEEWFQLPSDDGMKNSLIATVAVLACNRLMDQHRFGEADKLMDRLLEMDSGMIGLHRNMLLCDRIYCELISQNRQAVLDELFSKEQKKFMKSMKTSPSVVRTEYAWALLGQKDLKLAEKHKARFEKIARSYPYPSDIQSERELMELAEGLVPSPASSC